MNRRTLLQWMASAAAVLPFNARLRQYGLTPRELTPDAIQMLSEVTKTVIPQSIGDVRTRAMMARFIAWMSQYREGVPLSHGYGHPRLQRTPASPVPRYVAQLAALDAAARAKGGRWATLDLETQRALLDAAFTQAGVRALPARPNGQHVVADLMAIYYRSSEANDDCYNAAINREVCRPIQITTRRPAPLG